MITYIEILTLISLFLYIFHVSHWFLLIVGLVLAIWKMYLVARGLITVVDNCSSNFPKKRVSLLARRRWEFGRSVWFPKSNLGKMV